MHYLGDRWNDYRIDYVFDAGYGESLPATATKGSKFLLKNSTGLFSYTAVATDTWDGGKQIKGATSSARICLFYFDATEKGKLLYANTYGTAPKQFQGGSAEEINVSEGFMFLEKSTGYLWSWQYDENTDKYILYKVKGDKVERGETIAPVTGIIASGASNPSTCSAGDKFFNSTDKKIYTATGTNTWGTSVAIAANARYASSNEFKIYSYADSVFSF